MRTYQPVNDHDDLVRVVDGLLEELGVERRETGGEVTFAGLDPLRPTVLKVGAASAAVAVTNAIVSAIIWRERGGEGQDIHCELRKAFAYQSPWQDVLAQCTKLNGRSIMSQGNYGGEFLLPTRDGRFVVVIAPYPSQQVKVARIFRRGLVPSHLEQAARKWDAEDLEAAGQEISLPISMVRTVEEFQASDHWRDHAATPLIKIEKIGESEPEPLPPGDRPLAGVRALGMTHVVAGPTVLRQLAAQGADCLNLNLPRYVEEPNVYFQSNAGVRAAILDAASTPVPGTPATNRRAVYDLVRDADVFVENLKPQQAGREGYSAEDLAEVRPGLVYCCIKLNTTTGPWANWVGFDLNAGAFTGVYTAEGSPEQPRFPVGVNVVVDFLCGIVATAGVQAALLRRAREGGSYRVTVTLAQTTSFEMSLGLNDKAQLLALDELGPAHKIQTPNLVTGTTPYGELTRLGSQVEMSKTPEYWADPILVPPGSGRPEWLPNEARDRASMTTRRQAA